MAQTNNTNAINTAETTQQIDATTAAPSTALLLGHDGAWWDFWMLASLAIAAVAAGAVGAFTAGSVIVHKREAKASSDELERYKAETARKVAEANAAGLLAGEKAGRAQADIDAAKVELAKQTTLTAAAQLETEKLKSRLAWRVVSPEQESRFIKAVPASPHPGLNISMMVVAGDAEGAQYAEYIAKLLRRVGFSVESPGAAMFAGLLPQGVIIKVREQSSLAGQAAGVLQKALKTVGIEAPGSLDPSIPADSIQILIGIKPHAE